MKKTLKSSFAAIAFVAVAALGIAGVASTADAQPLKVGFVYVGPQNDNGWSQQHDLGRLAIEERFGDAIETSFVELVPEGPDAERVIRQLAESGHGLIFTTSFGFMNPTLKVAEDFPDVKFEHATGFKRADNVSTYSGRFYEGRSILGTIAGMMTKTNVIGYIGSFPIPEVIRGINAFTIAMRRVNPEAEVRVIWVNSWIDAAKDAQAAETLLDQGADVIVQHVDSPAPLLAAAERGAISFGQTVDNSSFAPDSVATSLIDNWGPYYIERVQAVLDGTWVSTDTWNGLDSSMQQMAPYASWLPADVLAAVQKLEADLTSGAVHAFAGPIKDQDGNVVAAAGEIIDDGTLLGMNYYVEGVLGNVPQ